MGGVGSGRLPNPENIVKRNYDRITTTGTPIFIPNLSGVKSEALKTSSTDITGGDFNSGALWASVAIVATNTASLSYVSDHIDETSSALISHSDDLSIHFTSGGLWSSMSYTANVAREASLAFISHSDDGSIHFTSGGLWDGVNETSSALSTHTASSAIHFTEASIDHANISNVTTSQHHTKYTDAEAVSALSSHTGDGSIHFTSGGLWDGIDETSSALISHKNDLSIHFTSGGLWSSMANVNNIAVQASLALVSHSGDSSDPHGTTLTQTNIISSGIASAAKVVITGDQTASAAAYVPNVLFNTSSGGITASNYTQGSLLVIYS